MGFTFSQDTQALIDTAGSSQDALKSANTAALAAQDTLAHAQDSYGDAQKAQQDAAQKSLADSTAAVQAIAKELGVSVPSVQAQDAVRALLARQAQQRK